MKRFILFMFIALFAFANFACTQVGTNNKAANGDVETSRETSETDELTEDEPTEIETKPEGNTEKKSFTDKEADSPEALVENLYKEEENENSPFFQNEKRELVDKYFTKDLAEMIWKDAVAAKDADVGILDFDPLYDAQDAEVADLKVGKPEIKGDKATVNVTFLNFGEEHTVKYQLAKENGKWRIEDIVYDKETLKQIFKTGKREGAETESEDN